jgi:hypothetical protein
MARIRSELRQKHHFQDPYLQELVRIEEANFVREYVWSCLHDADWQPPRDLRLDEFLPWFDASLRSHRVESRVSVHSSSQGPMISVGHAAHAPNVCAATIGKTSVNTKIAWPEVEAGLGVEQREGVRLRFARLTPGTSERFHARSTACSPLWSPHERWRRHLSM